MVYERIYPRSLEFGITVVPCQSKGQGFVIHAEAAMTIVSHWRFTSTEVDATELTYWNPKPGPASLPVSIVPFFTVNKLGSRFAHF